MSRKKSFSLLARASAAALLVLMLLAQHLPVSAQEPYSEIKLHPRALRQALANEARLGKGGAAGTAADSALPDAKALGESDEPVEKGAEVVPGKQKSSEQGTPGIPGKGNVPPGSKPPKIPNTPTPPPQQGMQPMQICQMIMQLLQQLQGDKNSQGESPQGQQGGGCPNGQCGGQNNPQNGQQPPGGGCPGGQCGVPQKGGVPSQLGPRSFNTFQGLNTGGGFSCGPGGCGNRRTGGLRSAASAYGGSREASFKRARPSEHAFGFGNSSSNSSLARAALSTTQSYQYLGSALTDEMCSEREREPEEVEQLSEALTKVEQDQEKQQQQQQQQGGQGGQIAQQILQGLMGALGGGGLGGGGGGGGGPASGGGGQGKNPWEGSYTDNSKPENVQDINEDPESLDKLTDEELKKFLEENQADICEMGSDEAKKKIEERLKEMKEQEEKTPSKEAQEVQSIVDSKGKDASGNPIPGAEQLATQADAIKSKVEGNPELRTPQAEGMQAAIDKAIASGGEAKHYGNEATQAVGQLANDIMKNPNMSPAQKATALGGLENTLYLQQSDALAASKLPGGADKAWDTFNHNMGQMSEGLSDRLASDKWLQANTTPESSVREFLKYSGYPGGTNVNQGNYGSCWLCPTTGLQYRATPGELAMVQNQGLTTGSITSPWTGQTVDVSNWLKSGDNALYNENLAVQNIRSPLITMDQEAMAAFSGYNQSGNGGDPYAGIKQGSYAYTGGVGHLIAGSGDSASILNGNAVQQMAWAPGHYWSKDVLNGTAQDASGNYTSTSSVIGNNSWGSEPNEVSAPFTAAGLNGIRMPGGGGGIGGGGGLGGLLGGGGFGPLGGGGGGNQNQNQNAQQTPNPIDEPKARECLAHICSDISKEGLKVPESCNEVDYMMVAAASPVASATPVTSPASVSSPSSSPASVYNSMEQEMAGDSMAYPKKPMDESMAMEVDPMDKMSRQKRKSPMGSLKRPPTKVIASGFEKF